MRPEEKRRSQLGRNCRVISAVRRGIFVSATRNLAKSVAVERGCFCHRAVENRPLAGTSKPATPRCFIHIKLIDAGKCFSISSLQRLVGITVSGQPPKPNLISSLLLECASAIAESRTSPCVLFPSLLNVPQRPVLIESEPQRRKRREHSRDTHPALAAHVPHQSGPSRAKGPHRSGGGSQQSCRCQYWP